MWSRFNDIVLSPLVHEIGIKTFEILTGKKRLSESPALFTRFSEPYPKRFKEPLRKVVVEFFDPEDKIVCEYALRHLKLHFFLESTRLDVPTIESLARRTRPVFKCFLDTNFLFSILGLHDNPSNEAALRLLELLAELPSDVEVKLYVLPITLDELRKVIKSVLAFLEDVTLPPNLAKAALSIHISGLVKKYLQAIETTGYSLKPSDYFSPYISNLRPILKSKQVIIFNKKVDDYKTQKEVNEDLDAQLEFEQSRYRDRAKTRDALLHDLILYYFVRDQREPVIESPLDAVYWIVTVDYRLLAFDTYKLRTSDYPIPVCIHPSTLIHMLEFWIPRTPELEKAMLSSLRLPFLFTEFDERSERVTLKILKTLSRFADAEELSTETVTAILVNDALRQKLANKEEIAEQVELIKEALIEEVKKKENLTRQLQKELLRTKEIKQMLEKELAKKDESIHELKEEIKKEKRVQSELVKKIECLERIEQKREEKRRNSERYHYVLYWVIAPVCLFLVGGIFFALQNFKPVPWLYVLRAEFTLLFVWFLIAIFRGSRKEYIKDWTVFLVLRKNFWTIFIGLIISVIATFLV